MPKCCGVESKQKVYPGGAVAYHCPVCGSDYAMPVGLECLNTYNPAIKVSKAKRVR